MSSSESEDGIILGRKSFLNAVDGAESDEESVQGSVGADSESPEASDNDSLKHAKHNDSKDSTTQKKEFIKNRVLLIPGRGISFRFRHLLGDLSLLLPHSKKTQKFDQKHNLFELNEHCELSNTNLAIYFETRKAKDLYMWMSKTPNGPSVRFQVTNRSRPILSFDSEFDMLPHLQLLKEIFTSIFGPPANSRRVKPFVDRCMSFSVQDGRIWVRNYQITTNMVKSRQEIKLVEMGPRFTLQIIRIFENSFHGATLYENEFYLSPNNQRRLKMGKQVIKHKKKSKDRMEKALKEELLRLEKDPLEMVFE